MYDVIVIGAGPAGISASLYAKRSNMNVLVLYNGESNLEKATEIENYYGFVDGISGKELYENGIKQAKNLGVEIRNEEVLYLEKKQENFKVNTADNEYLSKTVIIATGNKKLKPNIKGIEEFDGKGISYCAICDGFFYRGKNVAIIGSGNYAVSEANDLINLTNNITILSNGKKAPEIRADNVNTNEKVIKEIRGEKRVEVVEFMDNTVLKTDGIFIAEGVAGSTEFAKKLGILTQSNKIKINEKMETNIPGIYACGDCTGGLLQVSKSVYEGTIAGLEAIKYLKKSINDSVTKSNII